MKSHTTHHWIFFITLVVTSGSVQAANTSIPKNLDCTAIPNTNQSLCYSKIDNEIAPYVDWVLYVKSGSELKVHSAMDFQITIPGSIIFSDSGLYLAQEFTEEGHPHYEIYKTSDFLANMQATPVNYFADYDLSYIESLHDDGRLIYRVNNDECLEHNTGCLKTVNVLKTPGDN